MTEPRFQDLVVSGPLARLLTREWVWLTDFARIVKISTPTAKKLYESGQIRGVKVGARVRVYTDEVKRFLNEGNASRDAILPSGHFFDPQTPQDVDKLKELKMDIVDVRNAKTKLQQDIAKLVKDFEQATGANVNGISANFTINGGKSVLMQVDVSINI